MYIEFNNRRIRVELDASERKKVDVQSPFVKREDCGLVIDASFFSESRVVKDEHRYDLKHQEGSWCLTHPGGSDLAGIDVTPTHLDPRDSKNNIVLLLESPHKDEYSPSGALGPALGASGKNIAQFFAGHAIPILHHMGLTLDEAKVYSFCIVNPIPYQTSLVDIHKEGLIKSIRDKVWSALWDECRSDCISRLSAYRPSVILNGCTSSLKPLLFEVVSSLKEAQRFNVTHPSSWLRTFGGFKRA